VDIEAPSVGSRYGRWASLVVNAAAASLMC
jgi:hypothetical protein